MCRSWCGSGLDCGEPLTEQAIVDGRGREGTGPMCGECAHDPGGVRVYVAFGILDGPDATGIAWIQAL